MHSEGWHVLRIFAEHLVIIVCEDADVYASTCAGDLGERQAGALKSLIGDLDEQALLRVHGVGLRLGKSEEAGIEFSEVVVQEEAAAGDTRVGALVWAPECRRIEAVRRDLAPSS